MPRSSSTRWTSSRIGSSSPTHRGETIRRERRVDAALERVDRGPTGATGMWPWPPSGIRDAALVAKPRDVMSVSSSAK